MFEIGRAGERFDAGVGEIFGERAAEACAECLDAYAALAARPVGAEEFETQRAIAAEAAHFEDDLPRRMFQDAQDAADQIALVGPEVHERVFAFAFQLVVQIGKFG